MCSSSRSQGRAKTLISAIIIATHHYHLAAKINEAAAYHIPMNIHSGTAVCWICLEEGADEKGKPIVRDCACRGNDAGFAHTSCIIKYAETKCEECAGTHDFGIPWSKCPNCNQGYQNDLADQLAAAFVSYAKKTYGHPGNQFNDKLKVMLALRTQIELNRSGAARNEEAARKVGENLIRELLALVDQTKKQLGMNDGWARMAPTTLQWQQFKFISCHFEANAYYCLGQVYAFSQSEERTNTEIGHYKKARDLFNSVGDTEQANLMTNCMERASAILNGNKESQFEKTKQIYDDSVTRYGEKSEQAILTGVAYAFCLGREKRSIEAERLATKLAATSRQVFGEEYKCTKQAVNFLNKCKTRSVRVAKPGSDYNAFLPSVYKALRYENDGQVCIITGPPVPDSIRVGDGEGDSFSIPSTSIFPETGCPIICHGLLNAPHLNGKLGDVRSIAMGRSGEVRLTVCFEDKILGSAAVKPRNLRIAFDVTTKS